MCVVAICNQKGGVGKTTLSVHLGVAMARRGARVVVVDADPQGNATSWLLDASPAESGLFDLLVVNKSLGQIVVPSKRWGLGVLPGSGRTAEAMAFLSVTHRPFEFIAEALSPLGRIADFVFVDMPPSKASGFAELLYGAEWIIVPTQLERLSLEGVRLMADTVAKVRAERGGGPRLLGVVPNMTRANTREHQAQMVDLVGIFEGTVWPPLPLSVRVAEACAYGEVLFDLAPDDNVTRVMGLVVDRFAQAVGYEARA